MEEKQKANFYCGGCSCWTVVVLIGLFFLFKDQQLTTGVILKILGAIFVLEIIVPLAIVGVISLIVAIFGDD